MALFFQTQLGMGFRMLTSTGYTVRPAMAINMMFTVPVVRVFTFFTVVRVFTLFPVVRVFSVLHVQVCHPSQIRNIRYRSFASSASQDKVIIDLFWKSFYDQIDISYQNRRKSNATLYHDAVIKLLTRSKPSNGESLSHDKLCALQREIEDLTINFDEDSMFKTVPSLVQLLIGKDMITAKVYLKEMCNLSKQELFLINVMKKYTLEALLIHVLGSVFNCVQDLSVVKVSTLIDQLNSCVKVQAVNMGFQKAAGMDNVSVKRKVKKTRSKVTKSDYTIGVSLVEFLVERKIITLVTEKNIKMLHLPISKGKRRYKISTCYVRFNFDLSILPIKLNLPMVSKPLPWRYRKAESSQSGNGEVPLESKVDFSLPTFDDIEGGYLSGLTANIYNRFRLLTSRNYSNFYINLTSPDHLCNVLNKLQSQAFEINSKVLSFILENRYTLQEAGLLANSNLAMVNTKEASDLLRFCYFSDEEVQKVCKCDVLLTELMIQVQRARYEEFVLILARAYEGYKFYLPAFMDFRGRIYRAGVLHFHERDLARSLIVFASSAAEEELSQQREDDLRIKLECAAAFKYQKFQSLTQAGSWYKKNCSGISELDSNLIYFALKASDPFQFLAYVLSNERVSFSERVRGFNRIPVTQDASASAYQIMSLLLLNVEMGILTNLLPSPDHKIQDVYSCIKEDLMKFLRKEVESSKKYAIIKSRLTRKLVKTIFMPLIYGKTLHSIIKDLRDCYGSLLSAKDYADIANYCKYFWIHKYPDIVNFMKLINLIGWWCSFLNKPVQYSIPFFTTVQDYMRWERAFVWVYDRVVKKRSKVTLLVPTSDRDSRKSIVATCVNFIHQKDAFIAMTVVEKMMFKQAPIYTVHDNFITTPVFAAGVSPIYTQAFKEMGPPLRIINEFIKLNLIQDFDKLDDPIPGDYLRNQLTSLEPKDLTPKDKKKMSNKIDETLKCYKSYVITVGGMHHAEKWNEYKSLLDSWDSLGVNYSVHY